MYDGGNLKEPPDIANQFSVRKLTHTKWIDDDADNVREDKVPPDKSFIHAKYKLMVNAMRATRLNEDIKQHSEVSEDPWNLNTWIRTEDDRWDIKTEQQHEESRLHASNESYEEYATQTDTAFHRLQEPATLPPSTDTYLHIQSDHGANANITDNLRALSNVQWIKPTDVQSADKDSSLTVTAVGELSVRADDGNVYMVNCYYSATADGTLLSPTAFCRQFNWAYYGYHIYSNMDNNLGEIVYLGRDGVEDLVMTTEKFNDLWYHTADSNPLCRPVYTDETLDQMDHFKVNKLSDAAKWELWHQRLGHCGTTVLREMHKHTIGVPKLNGNAFYKCPSCMPGKMTKQPTHRKDNIGTTTSSKDEKSPSSTSDANEIPTSSDIPNPLSSQEVLDEWLDSIHLPDAEPGQHFHADFGFVRGSEFSLKTDDGKTITSIDGKNSYLLVADRKTRMIWVNVSSSKSAPVEEVRILLNKFKSKNPHRTIRTDQDQALAKSKAFSEMCVEEGFLVEPTGTDNSKQNSRAERPHLDLGNSMRCMLHASGKGPEFWSHALVMAVYIKNRIFHSALGITPYEAFTSFKPNLSDL